MSNLPVCVLAFAGEKDPETITSVIRGSYGLFSSDASLWLWSKGKYDCGSLSTDPWKTVLILLEYGWRLRNEVVLACKVSDPAPENRLKRGHETVYHLSKSLKYHYDRTMGSGMSMPPGRNHRGSVKTRSGVCGSKYAKQIGKSPFLSDEEKANAWKALAVTCEMMERGEISDFRMLLRGIHKATRAVAIRIDKDGFYIRTTKTHSSMVDDLWTAFPGENSSRISDNALLSILRLSCPEGGSVLDLFPCSESARVVVASGRSYLALGVGGVVECRDTVEESNVFEPEGVIHDQVQI